MSRIKRDISKRPKRSYSKRELSEIGLITIGDTFPIGSVSQSSASFPADIDLASYFIEKKQPNQVIEDFIRNFKKVVKKEENTRNHYVSDIKAGVDKRFALTIGELRNGNFKPERHNINQMKALMAPSDRKTIKVLLKSLATSNMGPQVYESLNNIVKDYRTIRWSSNDIFREKIEKNGKEIKLFDALYEDSTIKIDVLTYTDRYTEVSNNIYLAGNLNGKLRLINTSYDFTDPAEFLKEYDKGVRIDIERLFYSPVSFNYFKGLKRMWSLASAYIRDSRSKDSIYNHTIQILTPYLKGSLAELYQIKSEIDAILLADEITSSRQLYGKPIKGSYYSELSNRLDDWKVSIGHILDIPKVEVEHLLAIINNIGKLVAVWKKGIKKPKRKLLSKQEKRNLPQSYKSELKKSRINSALQLSKTHEIDKEIRERYIPQIHTYKPSKLFKISEREIFEATHPTLMRERDEEERRMRRYEYQLKKQRKKKANKRFNRIPEFSEETMKTLFPKKTLQQELEEDQLKRHQERVDMEANFARQKSLEIAQEEERNKFFQELTPHELVQMPDILNKLEKQQESIERIQERLNNAQEIINRGRTTESERLQKELNDTQEKLNEQKRKLFEGGGSEKKKRIVSRDKYERLPEDIVETIELLKNTIKNIVDKKTLDDLKKLGLYPINHVFLPNIIHYKRK